MDFQKVLEALDHLIEKRVQSAAYTRMLTAIIQDIENSENNTYKVSYDNGQTITIAVSIAPNGNEIQYQKGDSVQLLQYNGIGNTNTTLYILGKSKDFTEQNWVDLDDYFSSLTVFPIDEFDTEKKFILQDGTSVIENIKEYGSFILKAKFTVDNSNKVYNYGIKIILNFTNDIKPIEYMFDIYQMIGQPWLYQNMEQSYQQKIDEFYLPHLESITLTKFVDEGHNITISDMKISSAILNVSNDYTAMFRGNKKSVDFITDHQDNKASTTLQTIFYKNSQTFASSSCKYYWFIRDDSIEIDSEYYHKYGGIGWKCLNSYETIEYLNDTPQKIFNNDIGDTLTIDQNNAPHYHNYYKCIVEYGLRIAATQEREILNLDKTNINFTLTTENTTITKLDENTILNLTLNVSGDLSILKKIGWYYQRDDEDRQHLISFENTKDTVQQYVLNVPGLNDKLGKDFTVFTCVLLGEGSITLGQSHITIMRDLNGDFKEEIWYHDNGDSIVPSTPVNTIDGTWTKEIPSNAETKYIFAASRLVSATYQGPFGNIYCYSARGTGPAAAQLTEFNRLTNNGKDNGLYYSQNTENKLYINASYINTGTLRVGSDDKEKFFATVDGDQDVRIGGFTVGTTSLDWVNPKNNAEQVHLGQNGLILGDNKFKIDQQGNITWSSDNSPVTYEAILGQLKEKDQDGIYAIKNESGERVSIGINATAINTGILDAGIISVKNLSADVITGGTINGDQVTIKNLNIKQNDNIIFHADATEGAINPFYVNTPNLKLNVKEDGTVTDTGNIIATSGILNNLYIYNYTYDQPLYNIKEFNKKFTLTLPSEQSATGIVVQNGEEWSVYSLKEAYSWTRIGFDISSALITEYQLDNITQQNGNKIQTLEANFNPETGITFTIALQRQGTTGTVGNDTFSLTTELKLKYATKTNQSITKQVQTLQTFDKNFILDNIIDTTQAINTSYFYTVYSQFQEMAITQLYSSKAQLGDVTIANNTILINGIEIKCYDKDTDGFEVNVTAYLYYINNSITILLTEALQYDKCFEIKYIDKLDTQTILNTDYKQIYITVPANTTSVTKEFENIKNIKVADFIQNTDSTTAVPKIYNFKSITSKTTKEEKVKPWQGLPVLKINDSIIFSSNTEDLHDNTEAGYLGILKYYSNSMGHFWKQICATKVYGKNLYLVKYENYNYQVLNVLSALEALAQASGVSLSNYYIPLRQDQQGEN